MLYDDVRWRFSEFDHLVNREVVRPGHYLRQVGAVVPWDEFLNLLAPDDDADRGRPAEPPVLMLKLEYLRYHHNLSDRELLRRAETDLAFRWF